MSDHECDESYRECVESRKARVAKAIAEAPPYATVKDIAETAGVTDRTVKRERALLQKGTPVPNCNKPAKLPDGEDAYTSLQSLIDSGRRFGTIYADPPWRYDNIAARGAAEGHYRTMSLDEICALPVRELAAADAHLNLWVVNAVLPDFKRVFDAWGFTFKSNFAWCKPQMGCGNYWRNSHELLLTGVRGNATRFNDQALMSWDTASRYAHSEKPETVRYLIERASPGPYLELFARRQAPGWTCWGDELPTPPLPISSDSPAEAPTAAEKSAGRPVAPDAVPGMPEPPARRGAVYQTHP